MTKDELRARIAELEKENAELKKLIQPADIKEAKLITKPFPAYGQVRKVEVSDEL